MFYQKQQDSRHGYWQVFRGETAGDCHEWLADVDTERLADLLIESLQRQDPQRFVLYVVYNPNDKNSIRAVYSAEGTPEAESLVREAHRLHEQDEIESPSDYLNRHGFEDVPWTAVEV